MILYNYRLAKLCLAPICFAYHNEYFSYHRGGHFFTLVPPRGFSPVSFTLTEVKHPRSSQGVSLTRTRDEIYGEYIQKRLNIKMLCLFNKEKRQI